MRKSSTNINELATRLNLSKGTVSRILNDPAAPFSPETRRRVSALAHEMGYQPDPIARALATGSTGTVALWIRNLLTSYRARVAQSFETQIESQSRHLIIRLYGRDEEDEARGGDRARPQGTPDSVDGIITHGTPPRSWSHRARSGARRVPVVITGNEPAPDFDDTVGIDLAGASTEAVRHLLGTGRRRVAFVTPHWPQEQRYRAYVAAMTDAGLAPEVLHLADESRAFIRRAVRDHVAARGHPEALFCYNDDAAVAACRALCDLGLRVPDDVALVGCDGIEETEYRPTPITTIALPIDEMCLLAWQYLKRRLEEPDAPPQRAVLRPTLVVRESSRA